MAQTKATGLIMPAEFYTGYTLHPGYAPVNASTGLSQPGLPDGDSVLGQPDVLDDETSGSLEVGVVAIPHTPRGAQPYFTGHGIEVRPRAKYLQQAAKYVPVDLPAPLDDTADGQPTDDTETFSEAASWAERFYPASFPAHDAEFASLAHQADIEVGENEHSESGAVGIWSIAGRT